MTRYNIEKYNVEIDNFVKSNEKNLQFLRNKKIFLTGATGLVGTYMVDALLHDKAFPVEIYALTRKVESAEERFSKYKGDKRLHFVQGNLTEDITLEGENIDYVLHLASYTDPKNYALHPIDTMLINFNGCHRMLELAKKANCKKFFLASSVEIYGTSTEEMTESNYGVVNCMDPRACYNESKRACETLCASYKAEHGLDFVVGRLCRLFGPTILSTDTKALSQFIQKAIAGEDIVLKSKGEQQFSYLYVADAVTGIFKLLEAGESGEAYNISEENDVEKLKDIAGYIAKLNGKKVVFDLPSETESKGFSRAMKAVLPSEKIRALGWKPQVKVLEGIKRTCEILKELN